MTDKVLLVDDEPRVLDGYRRNLRSHRLTTAVGPMEGLRELHENGPFAVVVSDLQMPEMDGIEFLKNVEELSPNTVRVMLTGQADVGVSIAAVNEGHVFRFLTKPCPAELLGGTLDAGIEQYRLVEAERQLLEETLHGAVEVLTDVLGLVDEGSRAIASQVQRAVGRVAGALGIEGWEYELAAMLSQIGNLALPAEVAARLNRGAPLDASEQRIAAQSAEVGARLLERIPRLENVAAMIAAQEAPPTVDDSAPSDVVAIGATLIHFAVRLERLSASGAEPTEVATALQEMARGPFQLRVVGSLLNGQAEVWHEKSLPIGLLRIGMRINQELHAKNGVLLITRGQEITNATLERLHLFAAGIGIDEPIDVLTREA